VIFAGSRGTLSIRQNAARTHVAIFDAPLLGDPVATEHDVFVVTQVGVEALSAEGSRRWRLAGARFVGARGRDVVAVTSGELVHVRDGQPAERSRLPEVASAEPCSDGAGHWVVPGERGSLVFVDTRGAHARKVRVSRGALLRPICDTARGRVLVGGEDGTIAAVRAATAILPAPAGIR
jgi:hypothetical protein